MDKLKKLLEKTKPTSKVVQQKQLLQDRQKQFEEDQREQKKKQQESRDKHLKEMEEFFQYDIRRKKVKPNEDQEQISVSKEEVKTRLRALHQPVTLFAETEAERFKRMLKVQQFFKNNPTFDMRSYDEQFQLRLKQQEELNELDVKYRDRMIEPRLGDDPDFIKRKMEMIVKDKEEVPFANMCDQLILWISKILKEWGQSLQHKYNSQELKQKHKDSFGRLSSSAEDCRSLLLVLKRRKGNQEMIRSIYHIMNCCLVREYIQANDKYIELSIGNAPWPLGVANLSITVRKNGPKVSHVLNDELSRRWMQTIKRLISVSQEMYPSHDDYKKVGYSVKPTI